jgi:hypothetical protein
MVTRIASLGGVVSQVVIWGNEIHDSGDVSTTYDQDVHSISIGWRTSNVWILDNVIRDSSGSGVVVNAGSKAEQPSVHHVYRPQSRLPHPAGGLFVKQPWT